MNSTSLANGGTDSLVWPAFVSLLVSMFQEPVLQKWRQPLTSCGRCHRKHTPAKRSITKPPPKPATTPAAAVSPPWSPASSMLGVPLAVAVLVVTLVVAWVVSLAMVLTTGEATSNFLIATLLTPWLATTCGMSLTMLSTSVLEMAPNSVGLVWKSMILVTE